MREENEYLVKQTIAYCPEHSQSSSEPFSCDLEGISLSRIQELARSRVHVEARFVSNSNREKYSGQRFFLFDLILGLPINYWLAFMVSVSYGSMRAVAKHERSVRGARGDR